MAIPINRRILIIDDNPAIHADYRKILLADTEEATTRLAEMENALFGDPALGIPMPVTDFSLESAFQGEQGLAMLKDAIQQGKPFSLAFVDMRMPPGWDGLQTIQHLWKEDPNLQIVICTAYSDRSWTEICRTLGASDQLLILKKPFDSIEVLQCAHTLTEKWTLASLARLRIESLEELVQARTREVVTAHQVKNEFIANMSHELLTPMNGILGFTQALQATPMNRDQRELCSLLDECSHRLLGLIQDVLTFNDLEAERTKLERHGVNVRAILLEARTSLAIEARKKGILLLIEADERIPAKLIGDQGKMKQVLLKLAENAVKFTQQGQVTLRARLESAPFEAPRVRFDVIDTGTGIAPEILALLEQSFAQADGTANRKLGGIGMGLTLTRRLLRIMNSELRITSVPGKGSTFSFLLKLEPDLARQDIQDTTAQPGLGI